MTLLILENMITCHMILLMCTSNINLHTQTTSNPNPSCCPYGFHAAKPICHVSNTCGNNSKPLVPVVPTVDSYCPGIPLVLLPLSILFLFAESPLSTLCQGILTWCSYMAFLHGISYMAFLTRHSTRHHSHRVHSVEDGKFCFPTPVLVMAHEACHLDCCFHPPHMHPSPCLSPCPK